MITDIVLQATPREERGKNASRRLRASGRLPVAVYGEGRDAAAVSINARELGVILRSESGRHSIFTLAVEGAEDATVKIHEMELDPVTNRLVHLDLVRISLTETTRVSVPLEFVGEPVGMKLSGGMLEVHLHEIEIECLPKDIPANITIDVSNMDINDQLLVNQLPIDNDGITVITGEDHLVAVVTAPRVSVDEEAEAEETTPAAPAAPASES
jgi:large subunit ribosomal protein L25